MENLDGILHVNIKNQELLKSLIQDAINVNKQRIKMFKSDKMSTIENQMNNQISNSSLTTIINSLDRQIMECNDKIKFAESIMNSI